MSVFDKLPITSELADIFEAEIQDQGHEILERENGNRHGSWQHQVKVGEDEGVHRYVSFAVEPILDEDRGNPQARLTVSVGALRGRGFERDTVDHLAEIDGQQLDDQTELWMQSVTQQALRKVQRIRPEDLVEEPEFFEEGRRR